MQNSEKGANKDGDKSVCSRQTIQLGLFQGWLCVYDISAYLCIYNTLKSLLPENLNSLKVDDNCSSVKHDTSSNIQHSH